MARHKGETWKPNQRNRPNEEKGIWCPHCYSVHAWRSKKTLGVRYTKTFAGQWLMLWYCKRTGNVLKEQGLMGR